jgi:hypothetical protein
MNLPNDDSFQLEVVDNGVRSRTNSETESSVFRYMDPSSRRISTESISSAQPETLVSETLITHPATSPFVQPYANKLHKWSRTSEKTINKYIQKSLGYKTLYYETHFMYQFWHNIIYYSLILATCISLLIQAVNSTLVTTTNTSETTTTFLSSAELITNETRNMILTLLGSVFTALVGFITGIYTQTKYDTYATGCRDAAMAFSDFADDLQTLLTVPRHIRSDPYQVIHTVQIDYKKTLKNYAKYEIPHNIFKKFINDNANKGIIFDIVNNTNADQFDLHDGSLEQNLIANKFIDSLKTMRNDQDGFQPADPSRSNIKNKALKEILNEKIRKEGNVVIDI